MEEQYTKGFNDGVHFHEQLTWQQDDARRFWSVLFCVGVYALGIVSGITLVYYFR